MSEFYKKSFARNIGVFNEAEQEKLKNSTVAIAGVGGVGGIAAERIVRLGVGHLKIADPDVFEEANINRQFAATAKTIGENKTEAVGRALKEINPSLKLDLYPDGINEKNIADFLNGANLAVEEIEFFSFKERALFHREARKLGLYSMTAHSIGFGSPLFVFDPKGMSFEEFYKMPASEKEMASYQFPLERAVIEVPKYASNEMIMKVLEGASAIPTVSVGCSLAASLLTTETALIILNKRKPIVVPKCLRIDLFEQTLIYKDFSE